MTVCGDLTKGDVPGAARLVPAREAQAYVAKLEPALANLDGRPVFLLEDLESGTSHDLVTEIGESLVEDRPIEHLPVVALVAKCFSRGWSFRIWLADNDPNAYAKNTTEVSSLAQAMEQFERNQPCIRWHAS